MSAEGHFLMFCDVCSLSNLANHINLFIKRKDILIVIDINHGNVDKGVDVLAFDVLFDCQWCIGQRKE